MGWVWVPDAVEKPEQVGKAGYDYSLRASRIYLTCAFKMPVGDIRFCMRHNLLPPDGLRQKQMALWIGGAKAMHDRVTVWK